MNENKTIKENTDNSNITFSSRTGLFLRQIHQSLAKTAKWMKKEIALVIGAIIILAITLTITQATPISRWIAAPSTNCLAQGYGNTMVENNGIVYVLFGNSNSFKSYNPSTGECSVTSLANFPASASASMKLIKIDDDTLYATSASSSLFYHIRDNFWSYYNRSKADNTALPPPISLSGAPQGLGNTVTTYNNDLYILTGGGISFLKYSPATNTWSTLQNIFSSVGNGGAIVYPGTGTYLYAMRGNGTNNFYRYDLVGNSWSNMNTTPENVSSGGAITAVNGTDLYAFQGNGTRKFWKYNIAGGTWTNLPDLSAPDYVEGGGALTSIGSKIYALQGGVSSGFWELDLSAPTPAWAEKEPFPARVYSGGSLTTDGTYIYATKGKTSGLLYRYSPALNTWIQLETSHTEIGSSAYDQARGGISYVPIGGSGAPEIYMSTGRGSTSVESLARYVISSNEWPAYLSPSSHPTTISYGASAAYPAGSDNIFVLMGGNTNNFWKFLISRNLYLPVPVGKFDAVKEIMTWIPGLTGYQGTGSSVTKANGKLYHLLGSSYSFVEYDPVNNLWQQLPQPPGNITTGSAITTYDNNTLFASSGSSFWKYDIPNKTWFNNVVAKTPDGKPISQILGDNDEYNNRLNQAYGSHMVEKDGELYITLGGYSSGFVNYNPTKNRWNIRANLLGGIGSGASSVIAGNYMYTLVGGNSTSFYRHDIQNNTWTTMTSAPLSIFYGSTSAYPGGDFIYVLRGNETNNFFRYCIANTGSGCTPNTWTNLSSPSPAPHLVRSGGSMVAHNSTTLYAMSGNNTKNFMRFNITNSPAQGDGVWTDLSLIDPLPDTVASGGSLTSDGTFLYATRGNLTGTFWRYNPADPAGSRWTILQSAPVNIGYAADLLTDNYGNITYSPTLGEIFAMPGNGYGGFNQNGGNGPSPLYRYQLPASSGTPTDDYTWPSFAATDRPPSNFANGAALTYPGSGNFLYAFRGNNTTHFWQYDVPNNQWAIITQAKLDNNTPVSQGSSSQSQGTGNSITEVNGDFYVLNGNSTNIFQKYSPSTNTWTNLANTPATCGIGASMTKVDNNNIYVFAGGGNTNFWRYHIPSDSWIPFNTAYRSNGNAVSQGGNTQNTGNAMTKANDPATGNPLFFVTAGSNTVFQKYDPLTDKWSNLAPLPVSPSSGAALISINTDIYYKPQNNSSFYRYSIVENNWTTLATSPAVTYAGNNLAYPGSGDYIYALRGQGQAASNFYRYCISNTGSGCTANTWSTLADTPAATYAGGSLVFFNSNDLYALGGNGTRNFWKYDVGAGTWDSLVGNQPAFVSTVQSGGSLSTDGTYIYATVGANTKEFWRYNPAGVSGSRWYRFPATDLGSTGDIPANMGTVSTTLNRGSSILCDNCAGTGMKEIWAVTGNGVTGYPINDNAGLMFRFRIDPVTCNALGVNPGTGSNPCLGYNTWVHFPKPTVAPATVSYGGSITYPGSGNLLYAFRGTATNTFWAYNMSTNAWITTLTVAPATIGAGGSLTSYMNGGNPDIYALRGSSSNTFWLYRVTNIATGAGTWNPSGVPTVKPGTVASSGASLTTDGSGNIYASTGNSTNEIFRYNIGGNTWSSTSPGGASLTLPSPLYMGATSTLDARGGITYTAGGPSGGPELWAVTANGNSGSSFSTPTLFAGLIFRYPLTTGVNVGTWPISYTPPAQPTSGKTISIGAALTSPDSNSIFAFKGNTTNEFWRYDISGNSWNHTLPTAPATIASGGALTNNGGDTIFATRGYPSGAQNNSFYKYTITNSLYPGNGSWSTVASTPVSISNNIGSAGGGLVYTADAPVSGAQTVWMVPGHGRTPLDNVSLAQILYRYDAVADQWPFYTPANDAPTATLFSSGSDLTISADNLSIYALRGTEPAYAFGSANWSTSNPNFLKYTIATDTWSNLSNVLNNTNPKWVYSGGSITKADITPDALYIFTGGASKDVLKYSISGNSWLAPGNLLFPFLIGLQSTNDGGEIIYSPSTQKLLGSSGTDNTSPFTIYYVDLANRAVPTLSSALATTDSTFDILVTATDLNDLPVNVSQNTTITLSKKTGSGTLGGNLTGVIPNGQSSVTISGVTYNVAETNVELTATDTSGSPTLLPADVTLTVYGPSPTITQISPNSGSTMGGTEVTITGTNFINGSYVTFNGVGAPKVTFINSTELRVTTPAVSSVTVPNAVNVNVVAPSGQTGTSIGGFTYVAPTITGITPNGGGTAGGTPVTVSGNHFGPDFYIRSLTVNNSNAQLNNHPISFTFNTASLITAGKMRPDCGDIRVLDAGETRQLNYWVEDLTCNTVSTKVWVKIPSIPNGAKNIFLTYGNKLLTSQSNGENVFLFFDDFEATSLNTSKWTNTTGSPVIYDGKLILNDTEGIYAGNFAIPANTVWETSTDPRITSRYGSAIKGSGSTSVAWSYDAAVNIVSIFWSNTILYAETLTGNTSMGPYASGFRPYKITFRPNDTNQALFNYNNGATTTIANTNAGDGLYPTLYVGLGNFDAQWEYMFIRPYGGATEPSVGTFGPETGGALQVQFELGLGGPTFAAEDIELVNNSTIRAKSPATSNGTYNIIVTNGDGRTTRLDSAYAYGAPTITGVTPNIGSTAGGTNLTIGGTNFTEGGFRRPITVMNRSNSTLSNQTLYFTLDTAALISAGKLLSACQNIRVKDSDSVTYLNYWVEGCNSTLSRVWIRLPSLPPEGKTIYVHYGNPNYTSGATPENFFPTLASSNNKLWLKSDHGVTLASGFVSAWNDLSGSGNHVTQATPANQPAYNTTFQNGIPAISFDGTNDFLARTGFTGLPTGNANRSAFMVNRYDKAGVGGFAYGNNASLQTFGLVINGSGNLAVQGYGTDYSSTSNVIYQGVVLHEAVLNGINLIQWRNGTQILNTASTAFNTATTKIEIGREIDATPYIDMDLFEVIIFDKALSTEERQEIETYLTLKYDLNNNIQTTTYTGSEKGGSNTFYTHMGGIPVEAFASFRFTDGNNITAITPPHAAGTVDISVTTPNSLSVTAPNSYTFADPPTITTIFPTDGINNQQARSIDVIGTNISATTQLKLSKSGETDIICGNYRNITSTTLTCDFNIQYARTGNWDVNIYTPNLTPGPGSTLTNGFEITAAAPSISNISPSGGPTAGGTAVTITGDYFAFIGGNYTTPINIVNSGSEQTDYQARFTINTSAAIAAGKMRSDCGDIRVYTDIGLTNSLPYYLESGCNTTATVIWAKVPTITASSTTTIYINYGIPDRTSASDGNNVFLFFDDFESATIDANKWIVSGNAAWILEAADRFQGVYSSKNGIIGHSQSSYIASKNGDNLINIPSGKVGVIDFYWKVSSESNNDFNYYCKSDDDATLPTCTRSSGYINRISGTVAWTREQSTGTTLAAGPHRIKFAYEKDGSGVVGSDTGWIDAIKVRLYSATIADGTPATEITGSNQPVVTFDTTNSSSVTFVDSNTLIAMSPAHASGAVNLTVTNPDLQVGLSPIQFTYAPPPIVTAIVPSSGLTTESAKTVTISGDDFTATPTAKLTKTAQSDITCTSPRNFIDGSPDTFQCDLNLTGATGDGNWNVVVTNPDSQTATLTDGFSISFPPPTISGVVPNQGPSAGGTSVTITGTGFYQGEDILSLQYPINYPAGGPLTDYQIQLSLNTQQLAGSTMRSDCFDIRAFDEDGTTPLNYFIQNISACGTPTPLIIWVKVPSITSPGKSIVLKYGYPAWTSNDSSAPNTFVATVQNSIAEWQMDDLSGSTVTDSSSNGNNGIAYGTTIVNGLFGKARQFQGDPDYINYGVKASLNPIGANAEHSIEAWVKLESSQDAYPTLFNLWEESVSDPNQYDKSYLIDLPSQGVRYYVRNAANTSETLVQTSNLGIYDNNWHHIVTTNDRIGGATNTISIYVDGVQRATANIGNYGMRTVIPTINLRMARQWWSFSGGLQGLWGLIDNVHIYDRALTQSEITALYNNYGFLDPATGTVLVRKYSATPPTVGAATPGSNGPTRVTFDGAYAVNVILISPTTLTAVTPAGSPGLVDVTVTNPDDQSDTLVNGYTYIAPPTITSITPTTGHNQETLTGVVIDGANFVATPTVTLYIGVTPLSCANVTFVNTGRITCNLNLNGASAGLYNVEVTNPDTQAGTLINGFEVTYPQPTITTIDPAVGLVAGGESITITGTYFENGADVDFNEVFSPSVTWNNANSLTVITPAHTFGFKDVTVRNPNLMTVTATSGYEYIDPPIVTGIVPSTGANNQISLPVTISGSNFVAPPTAKLTKSGETDIICGTAYNFIDDRTDSFQCNFNIQDAMAGLWNLIVTNSNGQSSSPLVDAFEITFAPPTVTSIINNAVASGSTQQVTVGGTNFYSVDPDFITVDIGGSGGIGGTPCTTPVVVNPNSITCYLPALTVGTYDVTVTTGAGTDTAENLITYFDGPTVTLVTPDRGLITGGTNITITGTNFFGTPTVLMTHTPFEETTATNVIVVNSTTITATTPPSTEGPVDVKVITEAGNDTLNAGYTYELPPVDPDASLIEIFGYRIEPVNATYYDNNNLSPVNAALIKVTAVETLTGNRIIGRDVTLTATPPDDLVIHTANCNNMYDSSVGNVAVTDSYGTACFLVWSTAPPSFFGATSQLSATVAGGGYPDVLITNTVTVEIEQMSMTSILNYRFRNDDGTELTATPIGDISTPYYNAQNDLAFRLRFGLTRNMPLANSFNKADEFSPSATVDIADRPLPAPSPSGFSSFRAFPAYALDNSTNSLYIATPNRADSKARIFKYDLTDLTQAATYFEFPGTVNFTPPTPDDIDAPIDAGNHLITKMFIDEDNQLMYFVLTPYYNNNGLTRVYKINLQTETVVDVYAEPPYSLKGSLDAEIDLGKGFLYLTAGNSIFPNDNILPPTVQKISLNGPTEAMTMIGELTLSKIGGTINASAVDLTNQFLYVTTGYPQKIVKIDLDVSDSLPPVQVDEISLVPVSTASPNETVGVQSAVLDPVAGYAYFASSTNFTAGDYDGTQRAFITKVDIDPTRNFEVVSRLSLLPPNPANDYDYNADYVYMPPTFTQKTLFPYASLDQTNGYAFFPVARLNPVRDLVTWKLMRIHLDTFTRNSLYDEINYSDILNSTTIKGSIFHPETGRGYIVREMADGDVLTEFNSTTRQNLKLQSGQNVDPEYCNFASAPSYTWSDLPNADFELVDSVNFADGDPTGNVTGLLYDNNDHFTAGQMKDTSATTDRISIGRNELTEIEYSIKPTVNATGSYCFRLVDADPLNQNQVGGNPNLIYNIITGEFETANYHHYVPLTINGVIFDKNEVNVVEGTTTDSYGVKLATQPTDDVVITINADDARLILSEATLTFTDADWNTYQYIEASALDNEIVDGTTSALIRHTTTSVDPGYNNIIVQPVTSIVTDYGATIANVLATVSGTITFTPPGDFAFPDVTSGVSTPNFSPSLTVNIDEGRGTASDYILTMQTDDFCRAPGFCIPLSDVYSATSNLINVFSTFDAAEIGLFLANYLQDGETLNNRDTYVHVDSGQDRPLSSPITLIDSRNVPSGNTENPLQGSLDFDLNLMIDYGNISGLTGGTYSTLLTIDLNANPL